MQVSSLIDPISLTVTFLFLCRTQAENESQELDLEMKSSQDDVNAANDAVIVAEKALDAAAEEENVTEMKVGELKAVWEEAKAVLDELEQKLKSCSNEISSMSKEKAKLIKKAESAEIEGKKMSIKITKFHTEKGKAEKFLKNMVSKHSWIETEKDAFGVAGGDYDFEETNPQEMSTHLQALKAEQASLVSKSYTYCFSCVLQFITLILSQLHFICLSGEEN